MLLVHLLISLDPQKAHIIPRGGELHRSHSLDKRRKAQGSLQTLSSCQWRHLCVLLTCPLLLFFSIVAIF